MQGDLLKFFQAQNRVILQKKYAISLKCPLGNMIIEHFADGEFAVSYEESIRGKQVFDSIYFSEFG